MISAGKAGLESCATFLCAFALLSGAHAAGQEPGRDGVETDPIRCWWRTSVPAVRVGEPFSVVLTCAVVETDAVTVIPSQTELDPNALQLPPFDVLGGSHPADLRTADHRFFQYEYRLRLISEELFGKDVEVPDLKISYKVRTRVNGDPIEGRDLSYVLPATPVRVLSLVPAEASDIRDASAETFDDVGRRLSRATLLRVIGGVLIGFAVLAALVAAVRLLGGSRQRTPAARSLVSDAAILRELRRELSAIAHARRDAGWTDPLRARLLSALRIIGAYALDLAATPLAVPPGGPADTAAYDAPGQLTVRGRGLRGSDVTVAAWITTSVIAEELKRLGRMPGGVRAKPRARLLEPLETALAALTAAQYGRAIAVDDQVFDNALATALSVLRRLQIENVWIVKKVRGFRPLTAAFGNRVWSR
jgi:hypothetical protein